MTKSASVSTFAVLMLASISIGGTAAPGVRVLSQSNTSTVIEFTAPAADVNPGGKEGHFPIFLTA
jgi:hypothetical protein